MLASWWILSPIRNYSYYTYPIVNLKKEMKEAQVWRISEVEEGERVSENDWCQFKKFGSTEEFRSRRLGNFRFDYSPNRASDALSSHKSYLTSISLPGAKHDMPQFADDLTFADLVKIELGPWSKRMELLWECGSSDMFDFEGQQ